MREVNQTANLALVEWQENIAISDEPPSKYFPEMAAQSKLTPDELQQMAYWHALPQGWTDMEYHDFLAARRKAMAAVVRDAFERLR